jgi:hypothetical protein
MPSWSATRLIVPGLVAGSCRSSTANLVARSRSSSPYFLGADMTLIAMERSQVWLKAAGSINDDDTTPATTLMVFASDLCMVDPASPRSVVRTGQRDSPVH